MRREERSGSQILFGLLPEQTVDLQGKVWKVAHWEHPIHKTVDQEPLRRAIAKDAHGWRGRDAGLLDDLMSKREIEVRSLNFKDGVRVEAFPRVWICGSCRRLSSDATKTCRCGTKRWGQLHFVGFHECGAVFTPPIPRCKSHDDSIIRFPGTAAAREITFSCPVCKKVLKRGFPAPKCRVCGEGGVSYQVHRAGIVYSPRTVVVVNPVSIDRVRELRTAGGAERAFEWAAEGFKTASMRETALDKNGFYEQLIAQGIGKDLARATADAAEKAGDLRSNEDLTEELPETVRNDALGEAIAIATALDGARVRVADLASGVDSGTTLSSLYEVTYPTRIDDAGLQDVELCDRFPVLTGNYGYTRGSRDRSKLVPFRLNGAPLVYADIAETEALFVRLDPERVARWLELRGRNVGTWAGQKQARIAILKAAKIPAPGEDTVDTIGGDVLTLVHSIAHRFIRRLSVHAGIERTALAEYLLPSHLGFFVYAAARGDFVLGGLQAVFETELHHVLEDFRWGEYRCALDPGCEHGGGACMACLHLGEPSCRYFNSFLDRRLLFGSKGYFVMSDEPATVMTMR